MSPVINKNRAACQLQFDAIIWRRFAGNVLAVGSVISINMKTISLPNLLAIGGLAAALAGGAPARATTLPTPPAAPLAHPAGGNPAGWRHVSFRDGAEAQLLRNAYRTLATGDHDYRGHRVKAMHAVEAAAKLLGMDLAGDLRDRTPQPISDEKLREAQNQISQVLGAAEVKGQKHIVKHLNAAIQQINLALSIR